MSNEASTSTVYVRDVAAGKLPLTVAFAQQQRSAPADRMAAYYATYTTESGSNNALDDGQIKDED